MINLKKDIHPLTDFKRKTPEFRRQLRDSDRPIILTVDGRPEMVVHSVEAYQALVDEIRRLKLERLREEVAAGADQAERGEFANYSIKKLLAELDAE